MPDQNIYNNKGLNVAGITWALAALKQDADKYAKAEKYYKGEHDLNFATEKFLNAFGKLFQTLKLNLCPVPVDTIRDRLKIEGFSYVQQLSDDEALDADENAELAPEAKKQAKRIERRIREIWRRNRMKKRSGEVHKAAAMKGDAYVIVWKNADGKATFYPNEAGFVAVQYDAENPGHIVQAAKWLIEEKIELNDKGEAETKSYVRLTLYFADRLEKYITAEPATALPDNADAFKQYKPSDAGLALEAWPLVNPWGKVPVFHFGHNASIGKRGKGELEDLEVVQDGQNKTICDLMVAMEHQALKQRWATGIELPVDPKTGKPINPFLSGPDTIFAVTETDAKFGEFSAADLSQFIAVKKSFQADMGMISRIPLHYFTLSVGDVPSGNALEKLETPLSAKVEDLQDGHGCTWEDAVRFALKVEGIEDVDVETLWKDTTPKNEKEVVETLARKKESGLVSRRQAQREAGYNEPEITKMDGEMKTERSEQDEAAGAMLGKAFNGGAV